MGSSGAGKELVRDKMLIAKAKVGGRLVRESADASMRHQAVGDAGLGIGEGFVGFAEEFSFCL